MEDAPCWIGVGRLKISVILDFGGVSAFEMSKPTAEFLTHIRPKVVWGYLWTERGFRI